MKKIHHYRPNDNRIIFQLTYDKDEGRQSAITVIGNIPNVEVNKKIKVIGNYKNNINYGMEFMADHYEFLIPSSIIEIQRFLESGLFYGIGPETAKKIVDVFGEDTPSILKNNCEKLKEIKGVKQKTIDSIKDYMVLHYEKNELIMKLISEFNITGKLALKIFDAYGVNSINKIKENPYSLMLDVDGIGFGTSDKIALKMGLQNDPIRIRYTILNNIKNLCSNGNMYCSYIDIEKETLSKFKVSINVLDYIKDLEILGYVKFISEDKIYLKSYFLSEKNLAKEIIRVSNNGLSMEIDESLLKDVTMSLNSDQKNAVINIINNGLLILTGGPGTGKSKTIEAILNYFESKNLSVALAAPTGKAAKHIKDVTGRDATTLHRLLSIKNISKNYDIKRSSNEMIDADLVIVDEVSMMDTFLANNLFSSIKSGSKILLIGDKNQLPSVGSGNVLSDLLDTNLFKVVELKKIYRQNKNSMIVSNANAILNGNMIEYKNKGKTDFVFLEATNDTEISNLIIETFKAQLTQNGSQILTAFKKGDLGANEINKIIQNTINPEVKTTLPFKLGDKVMQIHNEYNRKKINKKGKIEEGVFNGDIGYVVSVDFDNACIDVEYDDNWKSTYLYDDLDNLILAYAITVHKSQGTEFPTVIIPISEYAPYITTRNLLYTAITRAENKIILIGKKSILTRIIDNDHHSDRKTSLKDYIVNKNSNIS